MLKRLQNHPKITLAAGLFAASGAALIFHEDRTAKLKNRWQATYRIFNLTSTAFRISLDYGYSIYWLSGGRYHSSTYEEKELQLAKLQQMQEESTIKMLQSSDTAEIDRYRKLITSTRLNIDNIVKEMASLSQDDKASVSLHHRNAVRLRDMCANNGGVYVKLGQHLAMLDHIFPKEYQVVLSSLLSKTPKSSWSSIRRIIKQDFGKYPEEIFEHIDTNPIASASLAQVHVAKGKDGKKFAVKVQHEGLKENSAGDMAAITYVVYLIPYWFKGVSYNWIADEMNANLPKELNFEEEKKNLEQCTANLSALISQGDVAIPTVVPSLSSKRVLTMSFEEGSYVSDLQSIRDMKVSLEDVSRLISTVFSEQTYRHGFVHCDPHEANLLIRRHPQKEGKPQLVLLDHGLYRKLDEEFRKNYTRLWQALVLGDAKAIEEYCRKLNAGEAYTLLAAMLVMRPWDDITSEDMSKLGNKKSDADSLLLQSYAKKYFREISALLKTVPSQLLLLLKTNDCLRHIDKLLDTPINTAAVIASVTADVIVREDVNSALEAFRQPNGPGLLHTTRRLGAILSAYLQVLTRVMGLHMLALSLRLDSFLTRLKQQVGRYVGFGWNDSACGSGSSGLSLSLLGK